MKEISQKILDFLIGHFTLTNDNDGFDVSKRIVCVLHLWSRSETLEDWDNWSIKEMVKLKTAISNAGD